MNSLNARVKKEIMKVSEIAGYLWSREWAERNAGNISINLTEYCENDTIKETGSTFKFTFPEEAAGLVIFVTGTGCHLRHLIDHPEEVACILRINDTATGYTIIWGGKKQHFAPTSELISHVKIHVFNKEHNPAHKAIVHTHPIELIVLSHHPIFKDQKKFNNALWKMCPEVKVFVPKGVHCTTYALPGSKALADKAIEGLKHHNVSLWEKHGALATGEDAEKAFDFLDVANKGAKMLLTAWAAGFDPAGLSQEQLKELEQFIDDDIAIDDK